MAIVISGGVALNRSRTISNSDSDRWARSDSDRWANRDGDRGLVRLHETTVIALCCFFLSVGNPICKATTLVRPLLTCASNVLRLFSDTTTKDRLL